MSPRSMPERSTRTGYRPGANHLALARRFAAGSGIDRAGLYATAGNVVSLLAGPVTALLVATRLSPEGQGFYYTFGSLAMLRTLAELGLGQVIIQFGSHEWAHLSLSPQGLLLGPADKRARLGSLAQVTLRWYLVAGFLMLASLLVAGPTLFHSANTLIAWEEPWIIYSIMTAIGFGLLPLFYVIQSCNFVTEYWFYRLLQQAVNGVALLAALVVGAGLWARPVAGGAGVVLSLVFLFRFRGIIKQLLAKVRGPGVGWKREVWPMQWRVAISMFTMLVPNMVFVPLLFRFAGPAVSGQLGMVVTLGSALTAFSTNWVVTKGPQFGIFISRHETGAAEALFQRSFRTGAVVGILTAGAMVLGVLMLQVQGTALGGRVLPADLCALYLCACLLHAGVTSINTYLRAFRVEPLVAVNAVGAVLILVAASVSAYFWQERGLVWAYLGALVIFQLPATLVMFRRFRASMAVWPV